MKKLLTIFFIVALFTKTFSQSCNPVWTGNGYGIIPDTATNLPPAYEGHPYSTTILFKVPPDTMVNIGFIKTKVIIYHLRIDSGYGPEQIPAMDSFRTAANPASGIFKGDSTGCISITGTPAMGSAGVYVITVYFTASVYVTLFKSDYEQHYINHGYRITVLPDTVTTGTEQSNPFFSGIYPNPFSNTTQINYFMPHSGNVNLKVFSLLGKLVADKNLNAVTGFNNYELNGEEIPAGEYFCTISFGNTKITRKIVKGNY